MFERLLRAQSRAFVVIALALALAGIVMAFGLPIGLFPQVSFPRVVVDLDAGSRPADQTALLVTRPVEEALRSDPRRAGRALGDHAAAPRRSRSISAGAAT